MGAIVAGNVFSGLYSDLLGTLLLLQWLTQATGMTSQINPTIPATLTDLGIRRRNCKPVSSNSRRCRQFYI